MKNKRENIVIKTSIISICANLILVGFKMSVGFLSNSIAIISDAINNLSDVLSSIVTIIGTKLAGKAPDKEHPYGHGRVEYTSSLIVSGIVLYAGITALVESAKKIFMPEEVNYSAATLVVLTTGIVIKFALGLFVKKKGHDVKSDSLVASGTDAFNDALLSISVLASAIIFLLFGVNLEAYVGVLLSLFIVPYFAFFAFLTTNAAPILYSSKVLVLPEAGSACRFSRRMAVASVIFSARDSLSAVSSVSASSLPSSSSSLRPRMSFSVRAIDSAFPIFAHRYSVYRPPACSLSPAG